MNCINGLVFIYCCVNCKHWENSFFFFFKIIWMLLSFSYLFKETKTVEMPIEIELFFCLLSHAYHAADEMIFYCFMSFVWRRCNSEIGNFNHWSNIHEQNKRKTLEIVKCEIIRVEYLIAHKCFNKDEIDEW